MDLREQAEKIQTREDLVLFVHHLIRDLRTSPEQWENTSLEAYLAAIAAWVQDMDGYYRNRGEAAPHHPTWKHVGEILLAARVYE
ncbi:MAG: DUF7660 family protein [Candidatus Entotheonellia bacterium]